MELDREREKNLVAGEEIRGEDSTSVVKAGNIVSEARGEGVDWFEGMRAGIKAVAAEAPGELSCEGEDELRIEMSCRWKESLPFRSLRG